MVPNPSKTTDDLIHLLEESGKGPYIGEAINQLEHSLQCANCGFKAGANDETVIAGLLHDIGQFLPVGEARDVHMKIKGNSVGRVGHEMIGEEYLKSLGFGENVCRMVGSHVSAKRYLTAVDESYYEGLSDASKKSLKFQGGPFQGEELEMFERDPLRDQMVLVRKCDDQAKVVGIESETPRAAAYRDMILRHLEAQL